MTIDEKDKQLFRTAVADTRPLPPGKTRYRADKPNPPLDKPARRDSLISTASQESGEILAIGDPLSYLRPGTNEKKLKQLRKGKIPYQTELDLHGQTAAAAEKILKAFLQECAQDRIDCALIIHGKGWRSKGFQPVLKNRLNDWLRQAPEVAAFCTAKPQDGGGGALYVLFAQTGQKK